MKYIIVMLLLLMNNIQSFSQNYEVGPFVGGANYVGDVGNSSYIRPNTAVFGGLVKWNQSTRHSFRASLLYTTLEGDDSEAEEARRKNRGYSFSNNLLEGSLGIELNWFEYDPHRREPQATPYLYTGLNLIYSDQFHLEDGELRDVVNKSEVSIPMVFGYKLTLLPWLSGGMELGVRYAFTDNLDGSHPSGIREEYKDDGFGNTNTNDWYIFTGLYVTFTFGEKPCFSHF